MNTPTLTLVQYYTGVALSAMLTDSDADYEYVAEHAVEIAEKAVARLKDARLRYDTELVDGLRNLCGYTQDGSATEVLIFQDDATNDWCVKVGKRSFFGRSFHAAIDAAMAKEGGAK